MYNLCALLFEVFDHLLYAHVLNPCGRAFPIAEALDLGADIVVTGRCVDSALALAPFIHKVG